MYGKYVSIHVVNSKLIRKTLKPYDGITDELKRFKDDYYSSLDKKTMQFVHCDTHR